MLLVAVEAKCHCMNVHVQVCKIYVLNLGGFFFFKSTAVFCEGSSVAVALVVCQAEALSEVRSLLL